MKQQSERCRPAQETGPPARCRSDRVPINHRGMYKLFSCRENGFFCTFFPTFAELECLYGDGRGGRVGQRLALIRDHQQQRVRVGELAVQAFLRVDASCQWDDWLMQSIVDCCIAQAEYQSGNTRNSYSYQHYSKFNAKIRIINLYLLFLIIGRSIRKQLQLDSGSD